MATKKTAPAQPAPVKKAATPAKKAPAKATAPAKKAAAPAAMKPVKTLFNKTTLLAHLTEHSGVESKVVKAVMATFEATLLASLSSKGAGEFLLPGVMKVIVQKVPAKKARTGIDPFTKQERKFAAKPASVKLRARFLKKVKDAAA